MEREMMWEGGSSSAVTEEGSGAGGGIGGGGGAGRRKPSWREKENNRRRERRRRAIAANIYNGLRAQGNYRLPKHCDNNEVLKALCKEAGWVVLPDGTTFRKGCKPPPSAVEHGGSSINTTPCFSQKLSPPSSSFPSPIPSYQCSLSSSSFPSPSHLDSTNPPLNNRFAFLSNSIPSSLPPLRISNCAPVTPPLSSPKVPKKNNLNWESFDLPCLASSVPTSPTRHRRFTPATIPECDESDWSTSGSFQRLRFQECSPMMVKPNFPTSNLVKSTGMNDAILEKGKGVKAWKGESFHEVGFDDLELTLGSGTAKV